MMTYFVMTGMLNLNSIILLFFPAVFQNLSDVPVLICKIVVYVCCTGATL